MPDYNERGFTKKRRAISHAFSKCTRAGYTRERTRVRIKLICLILTVIFFEHTFISRLRFHITFEGY